MLVLQPGLQAVQKVEEGEDAKGMSTFSIEACRLDIKSDRRLTIALLAEKQCLSWSWAARSLLQPS